MFVRKLPLVVDRMKLETSQSTRRGDEEVEVHGEPDHVDLRRRRFGAAGWRDLSQAWDQQLCVLPVAQQVRGDVGGRAQASQVARGRERAAQAYVRGSGA